MGPQALSLKQGPVPIQPASMIRNPCPQGAAAGAGLVGKGAGQAEGPPEAGKKAEPEVRAINMSRNNNNNNVAAAPPLIAPGTSPRQRRPSHAASPRPPHGNGAARADRAAHKPPRQRRSSQANMLTLMVKRHRLTC